MSGVFLQSCLDSTNKSSDTTASSSVFTLRDYSLTPFQCLALCILYREHIGTQTYHCWPIVYVSLTCLYGDSSSSVRLLWVLLVWVCPTDLRLGQRSPETRQRKPQISVTFHDSVGQSAFFFSGMSVTHSCRKLVYPLCTYANKLASWQWKRNNNVQQNLCAHI